VVAAALVGALELDLRAPVRPAVGSKPGGNLLVAANVVAVLRWMGVAVPLLVVANVVAVLLWMGVAVPPVAWLVAIELVLVPRWRPATAGQSFVGSGNIACCAAWQVLAKE
jgi:hypothetical protein